MLIELSVDNVAIIERAQLQFREGFSVLTGETGAGKSLVVDALELILGDRADADLVRAGAPKAVVQAVFDLSSRPDLVTLCADLGLPLEDDLLYVQREVQAEGRSQCRIGGKLSPVGTLKQLGRRLVDLHGQHDHQSLLHPDAHVEFLDEWIGEPVGAAKRAVQSAWIEASRLRSRVLDLDRAVREREHRLDLLRFQAQEIDRVAPVKGELREGEARLGRLKHAEKLLESTQEALASLCQGEHCATDGLRAALGRMNEVRRFDADLAGAIELLEIALANADEAARSLSAYLDGIEADPVELEALAGKLDSLRKLVKKYGESEASDPLESVLAYRERVEAELGELEASEGSREALSEALGRAEKTLLTAAHELTNLRKFHAERFEAEVAHHLAELGMERSLFQTHFRERALDANGSDAVEFLFSANAGEPARPLAKIASGGEISRLMLAIRAVSAGRAGVPILIFDEVDSGLSGRAAATVARKIADLSKHVQVIAISHLPQMAAKADSHFQIEKGEREGRVSTTVRRLETPERIEEIARLVAGDAVTDSARENARALLEVA